MLKCLRLTLLLLLYVFCSFAQSGKGTVKGRILSSNGEPAAFVPIGLKGTKYGTTTDNEGKYELKAPSGTYTLLVQFVGHEPEEQPIEIRQDEVSEMTDFTLRESTKELQEVVVQGTQGFSRSSSETVAKIPLKNLENPQVYNTVTKELIQDQVVVTYSDALKNVPGVALQLQNNSNAPGGTVATRGFSGGAYLRNGMPGMTVGVLDPINIEALEAIKGPSATLFGSSLTSFGGLFNRVTKRPMEKFHANVGYAGGSYGLSRITVDVNTPLNADNTLLFRITGAKHYEGTFQDAGFQNYAFVSPSLTYKASDRLTLRVDAEYITGKYNSFYRLFPDGSNSTGVHSPDQLGIDFRRRFVGDDLYSSATTGNFYTQADYQLSKRFKSQTNFSYSSTSSSGPSSYSSFQLGNQTLTRTASWTEYSRNAMIDVQQNFIGDFLIGKFRNRLLLGLDYYHGDTKSSSASVLFDTLNVANPGAAYSKLTRSALQSRLANVAFNRTSTEQNTFSAYVQDVFNLSERLLVLASVRVDRFVNQGTFNLTSRLTTGNYSQTALSPRFGVVFQPIKDRISLFANYLNGFQNVAPVTQPDQTISTFRPQQANQFEGGVKFNLLRGKVTSSLSYYSIQINNTVRADADRPGFSIQNGNQSSQGFEADVVCAPVAGLNLVLGYAHNESKYLKSSASVDGLRPPSAGPMDMINAWASYRISKGALKGIGFGFGGNYASENIVTLSTSSSFILPSYTVLNASVFYDQPLFRVGLKANNLNDETYFVGWSTVIPQMPRSFIAEFVLKFGNK